MCIYRFTPVKRLGFPINDPNLWTRDWNLRLVFSGFGEGLPGVFGVQRELRGGSPAGCGGGRKATRVPLKPGKGGSPVGIAALAAVGHLAQMGRCRRRWRRVCLWEPRGSRWREHEGGREGGGGLDACGPLDLCPTISESDEINSTDW